MKAKYLYLMSCTVLLIGLILGATQVFWSIYKEGVLVKEPQLHDLIKVKMPPMHIVKEVEELEKILPILARPKEKKIGPARLSAFGYRNINEVRKGKKEPKLYLARDFKHIVSFAFFGVSKSFCVIDGSYYSEGASLPGGGRILKIMPKKVLIEEGKVRKWLPVGSGVDQEQKGTKNSEGNV